MVSFFRVVFEVLRLDFRVSFYDFMFFRVVFYGWVLCFRVYFRVCFMDMFYGYVLG